MAGRTTAAKSLRGYSLTLLRPAIVKSTLNEPTPGWIKGMEVAGICPQIETKGSEQ
jgi:fatty acyl-CoA reductase